MTNDDIARTILDNGSYVVLSTADANGTPWASPVWYAFETYTTLFWISFPGAQHSLNIAARPSIAMVVFDSTVAPNCGQAVYMSATAAQVSDPAGVAAGMEVFSARSLRQGGEQWAADRVSGSARLRLYRADVHSHSILDPDSPYDERIGVSP